MGDWHNTNLPLLINLITLNATKKKTSIDARINGGILTLFFYNIKRDVLDYA
jgi:hypothetical protein